MTFQEAQAKFSAIVGSIKADMSSGELLQKKNQLIALQDSLPLDAEFDAIANAIADFAPKLTGVTIQAVLASLQSRDASIQGAADLLTNVSKKADADGRKLTFEKPKLVAAALNEAVVQLQDLQAAAKAKDFQQAAAKVDALATLVQNVIKSIKETA